MPLSVTHCEEDAAGNTEGSGATRGSSKRRDHDDGHEEEEEYRFPTGYTEPERFSQALEYHRSLLFDYTRRWEMAKATLPHHQQNLHSSNSDSRAKNCHKSLGDDNAHRTATTECDSDYKVPNINSGENSTSDATTAPAASSILEPLSYSSTAWPRHVPDAKDVPALEFDLHFCLKSLRFNKNPRQIADDLPAAAPPAPSPSSSPSSSMSRLSSRLNSKNSETTTSVASYSSYSSSLDPARRLCQNLQFRIASFYLTQACQPQKQREGYRIVQSLATQGHPDGMCLYGTCIAAKASVENRIAERNAATTSRGSTRDRFGSVFVVISTRISYAI
jgi:hypothetical protein